LAKERDTVAANRLHDCLGIVAERPVVHDLNLHVIGARGLLEHAAERM
jgi:hypothetical protein